MHKAIHGFLHFVSRVFDNARRVRKNNLKIVATQNTNNAMPRRLRFIGDDGHALADQSIHQSAFANIRPTNDIYETGFVHKEDLSLFKNSRRSLLRRILFFGGSHCEIFPRKNFAMAASLEFSLAILIAKVFFGRS